MMMKMGYVGKSFAMGALGIVGTIIAACGGGGITPTIASANTPSENVLFSMGYQWIDGVENNNPEKWKTLQGGRVSIGSGNWQNPGQAAWGFGGWGTFTQNDIDAKGWVGVIFNHSQAISAGDYIFYSVTAPKGNSVDITNTDTLTITMGNEKMWDQANTHKQVSIHLVSGNSDCSHKQTLRNTNQAATYNIPLSSFNCSANILSAVQKVEIKVLPGEGNLEADSSTSLNDTLIQLGPIAFSKNYL